MRIGPYEVKGELGRGGMGVVFEARSPEGAGVAIKVLLGVADAEAVASFEREKRLLWTLGVAEGFVPILDAGVENGRPYLVMPLLTGGTLRARFAKGRMTLRDSVSLAIQLAQAVGRAHERGIVHRDLKPENVIFTADGAPLVADLGLAKHFRRDVLGASHSVSFSRSNTIVGTAGYIAPEQVADSKRITPAADVFALAAMLYESLTGSRPFAGKNMIEFEQALASRARPLREGAPAAPAWLETVLTQGLALEPSRRFPDGQAFARALVGGGARPTRAPLAIGAGVVGLLALAVPGVLLLARAPKENHPVSPPGVAPEVSLVVARPVPPVSPVSPPAPVGLTARALGERGQAKLASQQWEEAASDFTRAIELDQGVASSWMGRALARAYRGDRRGAEADATRALALAPTDPVLWNQRSLTRSMARDLEGAIDDNTKAIELDPRYAYAYAGRGLLRGQRGELDGAIADGERAIALAPGMAEGWVARASGRYGRGDFEGTVDDATKALALDPGRLELIMLRGSASVRLRRLDAAIADFTTLIERNPENPTAWHCRGDARGTKGDWAGAVADFSRMIEADPSNHDAWNSRGWYRAKCGDPDGGIADCTRALELDPRDANSLHSRGWARAKKGDDPGAIADFTRAIELDPKLADPRNDRGRARERAGDARGAIADYERFLELAPNDPDAPDVRRRLEALR